MKHCKTPQRTSVTHSPNLLATTRAVTALTIIPKKQLNSAPHSQLQSREHICKCTGCDPLGHLKGSNHVHHGFSCVSVIILQKLLMGLATAHCIQHHTQLWELQHLEVKEQVSHSAGSRNRLQIPSFPSLGSEVATPFPPSQLTSHQQCEFQKCQATQQPKCHSKRDPQTDLEKLCNS